MTYINYITKQHNNSLYVTTFTFDFGGNKKFSVNITEEVLHHPEGKDWYINKLARQVFHGFLKPYILYTKPKYNHNWAHEVVVQLEKEIAQKWDHIPTIPQDTGIYESPVQKMLGHDYFTTKQIEYVKEEIHKSTNYLTQASQAAKLKLTDTDLKQLAELVLDGKAEISDIKEALNYFKDKDTGLKKLKPKSNIKPKPKPNPFSQQLSSDVVRQLAKLCPDINKIEVACPVKGCESKSKGPISYMVQHLNDSQHGWSREQIADWLETLDADIQLKDRSESEPTMDEDFGKKLDKHIFPEFPPF